MSNSIERQAEDVYERDNDSSPVTGRFSDDTYATQSHQGTGNDIPVLADDAVDEDPMQPPHSNTDQQLEQDENEAIDRSNIISGDRLRHAKPQSTWKYNEGPGEDDLPAEVKNATY